MTTVDSLGLMEPGMLLRATTGTKGLLIWTASYYNRTHAIRPIRLHEMVVLIYVKNNKIGYPIDAFILATDGTLGWVDALHWEVV